MTASIKLKKGESNDLPELQQHFADVVNEICKADCYGDQMACTSGIVENINYQRWIGALLQQYIIVVIPDEIVGFAALANGNYIDFLYIHKDHQR